MQTVFRNFLWHNFLWHNFLWRTLLRRSLLCLLTLLLAATPLLASGPTGARYTWASFSYSWNKNAQPQVQLTKAVPTSYGYSVDYGHTTTLEVLMEHGAVHSTCAHFVGGGENDAGGRVFMLLMAKSMEVGTFRWPQSQVDEVKEAFKIMRKERREYRYNTTEFVYDYSPESGWEFCMTYLPDSK